jgi:SAM-dependent methyltransferase
VEPVRQAYGALAKPYIERFGSTTSVHPDDLALIVRHLAVRHGTVLDAGCGPGHLAAHLCSLGVDARGLDLVPELVDHARATHPGCHYQLGSMRHLPFADRSLAGVLAWYSLIHTPPDEIDAVLAELRRATAPGGPLVVGFVDGDDVVAFEHKVVTAYCWPADELSARLQRAGFTEVERQQRPGTDRPGQRPHAAIAATAN